MTGVRARALTLASDNHNSTLDEFPHASLELAGFWDGPQLHFRMDAAGQAGG